MNNVSPPERGTPSTLGSGLSLDQFEQILTSSEQPVLELRQLTDPAGLEFLFFLELCRRIKLGPSISNSLRYSPSYLLYISQEIAQTSALPIATPSYLRESLATLEAKLVDGGAWRQDIPLWWHPLPPEDALESRWRQWNQGGNHPLRLPLDETAAHKLADSSSWLMAPVIDIPLVRSLYQELEYGYQSGALNLERAGVGVSSTISTSRWDWVHYSSGFEPKLIEQAPITAAFIQWSLSYLGDWLIRMLPKKQILPPQKVMLARYPAPSGGYAAHMDNPGRRKDNGRVLTIVIYLNPPEKACQGGELAIWSPEVKANTEPSFVFSTSGGSAVFFDSRTIAHQVRPLEKGPARWALTFWCNDSTPDPAPYYPRPSLSVEDVLLPIENPPLPANTILFHELADGKRSGSLIVKKPGTTKPRAGIVSTVCGAGSALEDWCAYHFALGFAHIVLIFDHLEEPSEAIVASRLRSVHPPSRLTIWSGEYLVETSWHTLADDEETIDLKRFAKSGSLSMAIPARQTLNASAALSAVKKNELDIEPLEWLLHLDHDELFYLSGAGRGGANLADHLSAAMESDIQLIRYANHELLSPHEVGTPLLFKINPSLAKSRLGSGGWNKMQQFLHTTSAESRPYFNGYANGKSAVSVRTAIRAAGVHGWQLEGRNSDDISIFVAGPFILHMHLASAESFRKKYLAMAASPEPDGDVLFDTPVAEAAALNLIRELENEGAGEEYIVNQLDALHSRLTSFSESDIEILRDAGLLISPVLQFAGYGGI